MKQVYLDLKARLEATLTKAAMAAIGVPTEADFITVLLFENQFERMEQGEEIPMPLPCVIISFSGPNEWKQLGEGVQMLDPFIINAHVCKEIYDASTDNVSIAAGVIGLQDLPMFDLKQLVHKQLQEFEPTNVAKMVRFDEILDEKIKNINHHILRYRSNLIDTDTARPVGGTMSAPPYTIVITENKVNTLP